MERRTAPRVHVNDEFASIDGHLSEYVADISPGGIFLRCEGSLPVGTQVNLRFTVLLDDIETVEGVGEVVNHRQGDTRGLGIRFIQLTDQSRIVLERLQSQREP